MARLSFEEMEMESEEPENILESQLSDNNYMIGFITANIVGLQYYTGTVNGREMVGLVRESDNRYDPNAIKVLNMRGQQVGHIERIVASALAPYIDQHLILIEGIVPKGFKSKPAYKMPCQIYVFSHRDLMETALATLTEAGINIVTAADQEFMTTQSIAAQEKIGEESRPKEEKKRLDEIFGSVHGAGKRRLMEPSDTVVSGLLVHQKEALAWMVQRENSMELPPFWEVSCKKGRSHEKIYKNVLTNFETSERPNALRGGILADDMGLGKTLALLSLIATNQPGAELPPIVDIDFSSQNPKPSSENPYLENPKPSSENPNPVNANPSSENPNPVNANPSSENPNFESPKPSLTNLQLSCENPKARAGKRKRDGSSKKTHVHANNEFASSSKELEESGFEPPDPRGPKTTLVVCPPSVISNWVTQLEEHTKPGKLRVCLFHGDQRIREANELCKFDIVLTTYSTLGSELDYPGSPMKEVAWLRVILDEAHFIKNAGTKQAKAAIALKSERRWAVTGTPIQNSSFDLFTLMAFLHFQPFSIKSYWNSLVQRPLVQGSASGRSRLRALMEAIALRRTKDMKINGQCLVELPPKVIQIHPVELSHEERQLYDNLEAEGKKVVQHYINSGTVLNNYTTVLQIILRLRQVCDDPAMCPSDVEFLMSSLKMEDASSNPDLLKKLLSILQDGDDFDCPVCLSPPTEAIITSCSHVFCKKCIEKILKHLKPRCPMCRKDLTESDLFSSPKAAADEVKPNKGSTNSSKVNALISLLKESHNNDPTKKSVIFSQFKKMLDLLQEPLEREGFKFVRIDGSMSSKKRAASITAFASTKPSSPTILLASLKAAGVGINLTVASDVYMFDPWWNPAAEDQAMDRVHRIGQTRSVRVLRLVVRDSIEESILEMQERKRKLASSAFKKSEKEQRKMRVEDVQHLMRL